VVPFIQQGSLAARLKSNMKVHDELTELRNTFRGRAVAIAEDDRASIVCIISEASVIFARYLPDSSAITLSISGPE